MKKEQPYTLLPELFLRAPFYSYGDYHPHKLKEILTEPFFKNSLWLASPSFYRIIEKKHFDYTTLSEKEINSLLKYYNRMSFRATPFGSFASFTVLRWSSDSRVNLKANAAGFLHLLPSNEFLGELADHSGGPGDNYRISLNPTLYRFGPAFRFIRSSVPSAGKYTYLLSSIAAEWLTRVILRKLQREDFSYAQLVQLIMEKAGCPVTDAKDFLHFLLDQQVLYGPAQGDVIEGIASGTLFREQSGGYSISPELGNWPGAARLPASHPVLLSTLAAQIQNPATGRTVESLFYGALERPLESGGLPLHYQEGLKRGLTALQHLSVPSEVPALKRFIDAFREKFDQQRVPLLVALDPDRGISYMQAEGAAKSEGVLKDLPFQMASAPGQPLNWNAVHRLFVRLWLHNTQRDPRSPIVIRDSDWGELTSRFNPDQAAPTLAVLFSRAGGKLLLEMVSSISATSLVGRFNLFSQETEDLCRKLAAIEADLNPEVIFADICQHTDRHVDNINRRKPVYDYHIPVNVYSDVPAEQQIALSDLWLSVHQNELILESAKLGKRIIPRLSTAFNFMHNTMSVFRLLCDLQFQGLENNLSFDLERFFPGLDFYPRVEYAEVVLSPARWHIKQADIKLLTQLPLSLGRLHLYLQKHQIPSWITLGSGDQQLTFDLGGDPQALHFLACIKNSSSQMVREYLLPEDTVLSEKRPMNGQFVAFFAAGAPTYQGLPVLKHFEEQRRRRFLPGSEWIYLKIYCTAEAGNQVLLQGIAPLIRQYAQVINTWFFIRYTDPDHHIRLRIRAGSTETSKLLMAIRDTLVAPEFYGLVKKCQPETYEREVERYSSARMAQVEELFCLGSMVAINRISDGAPESTLAKFRIIHTMISCFFHDPEEKEAFLSVRAAGFLAEYRELKSLKRGMDQRYREIRAGLRSVLAGSEADIQRHAGPDQAISEMLKALVALAQSVNDWTPAKRNALIGDLVHMQVNRMFNERQREHETFIYHCLFKEIQSDRAINKG